VAKKRKGISKKIRFEVFKRDSFTCQYCGKAAPDVVLHVDHIDPVSKGGADEIINFITSCFDCNSGKGDRALDDSSILHRQRAQLADLSERREQLKLLVEWREGLREVKAGALQAACEQWKKLSRYIVTETGQKPLSKAIRDFGLSAVLEAMDIAVEQYVEFDDGVPKADSVFLAFKRIGGICKVKSGGDSERDLYYVRGILRNRVHVDERHVMSLLRDALRAGVDSEHMKAAAVKCRSWTDFCSWLAELVAEASK
jgi:hypothetical protein